MDIVKINNNYKIIKSNDELANFSFYEKQNEFYINFLNANLYCIDKCLLLLINRLKNKMYNVLHFEIENKKNLDYFLKLFLQKEMLSINYINDIINISVILNQCTNNNVKIIPLWFGPRRKWSGNYVNDALDLVKFILFHEINLDKGIKCDSRLIINIPYEKTVLEKTQHIKDYVYDFQNHKTINGEIFVEERENIGISYGAFAYAFEKYKNLYDFWFFNEDDYILDKTNYMLNNYNQFRRIDNNFGYIGESAVCPNYPLSKYPTHIHFGLGFTSQQILNQVGKLAHLPTKTDSAVNHELYGEIPLTNDIYKLGYDLTISENYNCTIEWLAKWENSSKLKSFNENMRNYNPKNIGKKVFI